MVADVGPASAWIAAGAAALTGYSDGPALVAPDRLVTVIRSAGARLSEHLDGVDTLALLTERATISGLRRGGRVSCGGATRLLATGDGWIAVSLARREDRDAVPAWLEIDPIEPDGPGPGDQSTGQSVGQSVGDESADAVWAVVGEVVAGRSASALVARARLLGMPASVLGEATNHAAGMAVETGPPMAPAVIATLCGSAPPAEGLDGLVVVDLSSLWAGPLCGRLLQAAGARVCKVESVHRPDGARQGPPEFFARMNDGKEPVSVELRTREGVDVLRRMLTAADVVIEGSRPRALAQLGIDARALVATGPQVWVSITGHGREVPYGSWVGFGDDAAVAGGLVAWSADGPLFCADAIADPLTGICAASSVLDALERGGRWVLDVALSRVAASIADGVPPEPWTPVAL